MFTASTELERYAWLSIAAALATITLKTLAWWLTGSVGLLSDALESIVNLAAALLALTMLRVAASPPDENHPYGFSKAEYFAAGIEGALIVLAAAGILASAIPRLVEPQPIQAPLLGLALSAAASGINLGVGM
ncbi:MAG TPA: cation diffusion facilitator family transporter, partial [Burkholderiales bacterium]|nr:cation diffusion facilitator family transporter [Burkholderiales bacterium]